MKFTSLSELNKTLSCNPFSNYAWLRLDNYLVVVAEDKETDNFLITVEDNGHLPLTVAWFSQEGQKARLYQRAEGVKPGEVDFSGLSLMILTGAKSQCLVASPLVRLRDYDDLGDESLRKNAPAALDEKALKVLKSLIFLDNCLSFN